MTRLWATGGSLAQSGSAGRSLLKSIWKMRWAGRGVSACHCTMFWPPPVLVTDACDSRAEYSWSVANDTPLDSAFRASAVYWAAPAWLDHATQATACGVAASLAGARTPTAPATGFLPPGAPPRWNLAAATSPRHPPSPPM